MHIAWPIPPFLISTEWKWWTQQMIKLSISVLKLGYKVQRGIKCNRELMGRLKKLTPAATTSRPPKGPKFERKVSCVPLKKKQLLLHIVISQNIRKGRQKWFSFLLCQRRRLTHLTQKTLANVFDQEKIYNNCSFTSFSIENWIR